MRVWSAGKAARHCLICGRAVGVLAANVTRAAPTESAPSMVLPKSRLDGLGGGSGGSVIVLPQLLPETCGLPQGQGQERGECVAFPLGQVVECRREPAIPLSPVVHR